MSDKTETAVLAGGCAWVMQQLLRHPNGVVLHPRGMERRRGRQPDRGEPWWCEEQRRTAIRAIPRDPSPPSLGAAWKRPTGRLWPKRAGAPEPQAALEFMNYAYHPKVQADIAEYVSYVTPVAGVKEILRKRDPALASNQLIFPSEKYTANCTFEPVLGGEQGNEVTKAFDRVLAG